MQQDEIEPTASMMHKIIDKSLTISGYLLVGLIGLLIGIVLGVAIA